MKFMISRYNIIIDCFLCGITVCGMSSAGGGGGGGGGGGSDACVMYCSQWGNPE